MKHVQGMFGLTLILLCDTPPFSPSGLGNPMYVESRLKNQSYLAHHGYSCSRSRACFNEDAFWIKESCAFIIYNVLTHNWSEMHLLTCFVNAVYLKCTAVHHVSTHIFCKVIKVDFIIWCHYLIQLKSSKVASG